MKKWMIVCLSVLALALLAYNAIRQKVNRAGDERKLYVSRLHYKFSGVVDSVRRINSQKGLIIFHSNDSIDETIENYLGQKGRLKSGARFLIFRPAGKITIFSPAGGKAAIGDSIYVDSDADLLLLFRNGEKISETVISKNLIGAPF
jgi:hypothetical protein